MSTLPVVPERVSTHAGPARPDPIAARLAEIERACQVLATQLEELRAAAAEIRELRADGLPMAKIVESGPGVRARRDVRAAWSEVNHALHGYREETVRTLVDDEGLTIADVARVTGNARQVISRLYHGDGR
jgi:hypothetical protein